MKDPEIDRLLHKLIDFWHENYIKMELGRYLGMSREEYELFVSDSGAWEEQYGEEWYSVNRLLEVLFGDEE